MTDLYAALDRPFTLASGRPVQPGESIPADALTTIEVPATDDTPASEHLDPDDQRLLDLGHLIPADPPAPANGNDGETPQPPLPASTDGESPTPEAAGSPDGEPAVDETDTPKPAARRRGRTTLED